MANTTKRMLSMSLKKLLSKTTLDSITIQDITDDAEVSRKTFYYHFQDIYDLLDWTLQEDIHRLIVNEIELDNWEESIAALFAYMQANRLLILNAFHSLERDTLEREVFKLLSPLLHRLFSAQSGFDRLCEVQNRISLEIHQGYVGKTVRVLCDGRDKDMLTARTEGGRLVRFAGDDSLIGQFFDVTITGCTTWSLVGELR